MDGRSRRDFLAKALAGSGLWALRAAATGLPLAFLRNPTAYAAEACGVAAPDATAPDFLIMSVDRSGDPLNANAPGSYVAGAVNNPDPTMAPTAIRLGSVTSRAALPWTQLSPDLLNRMAFIHHRNLTVSHNQLESLMRLHGAVKTAAGRGEEMLPSAIAQETKAALQTIQTDPVCLSTAENFTINGLPIAAVLPSDLKTLFAPASTQLGSLQTLRDTTIDAIHAQLKTSGTKTQRSFLDRFEAGRIQARALGDCISTLLARLPADPRTNGPKDQVLTAVVLFKLRVTPVVTMHLAFGGDNHRDEAFGIEALQTTQGIDAIQFLWDELKAAGLENSTTFASFNVFGRSLGPSKEGRDHNGAHHVMNIFGRRVRAGVIGGPAPLGSDFGATAINSTDGRSQTGGDISADDTLPSAAKTLAAAVGLSSDRLDVRINGGKVVRAALLT